MRKIVYVKYAHEPFVGRVTRAQGKFWDVQVVLMLAPCPYSFVGKSYNLYRSTLAEMREL